ncbi:MAG TPA: SDR family oxidoreductase [Candidatus Binataceae bacterium]|nr:SDR family oxidoreductase [Candidatus Binataceae bacterium]
MATALITGASSGLGERFAYALGQEKYDLILVARRKERLQSVAEEATRKGAHSVTVIQADLSERNAPQMVFQRIESDRITVDLLINNAGFGTSGRFYQLPLGRELEEIDLNVMALVALTRLFLPAMVARRGGTIMNIASTAAFQAVPHMATYAATKAFVLSFSQALSTELSGTGVQVMTLCPGPTHTEFQKIANTQRARVPAFAYMDADTVVAQGLSAMRRGKSLYINGLLNTAMAEAVRITPRQMVTRLAGSMFRLES